MWQRCCFETFFKVGHCDGAITVCATLEGLWDLPTRYLPGTYETVFSVASQAASSVSCHGRRAPLKGFPEMVVRLLLRGTIVNRTSGIHKNLYI